MPTHVSACPRMGGHVDAWRHMETHGDAWRRMETHGDAWRRMYMQVFWGENRAILGGKRGIPTQYRLPLRLGRQRRGRRRRDGHIKNKTGTSRDPRTATAARAPARESLSDARFSRTRARDCGARGACREARAGGPRVPPPPSPPRPCGRACACVHILIVKYA